MTNQNKIHCPYFPACGCSIGASLRSCDPSPLPMKKVKGKTIKLFLCAAFCIVLAIGALAMLGVVWLIDWLK